MNIKQVRLLKIEIENVPKDFVDVLFATPQDNGLGNLTGWCNSCFYHGEWKIVVLRTMVIFVTIRMLMFKGICIKLCGFLKLFYYTPPWKLM
jgi:hypothetical protein